MKKEEKFQSLPQETYIPLPVTDQTANTMRPKLPIATRKAPEERCGMALRIGSTNIDGTSRILYRVFIHVQGKRYQMMLPTLFVLIEGCFQDYEQWSEQWRTMFSSETI